ncbi:cytochrome c oxidase subunit II [Halovivax asiaticus JCM 14624]|uniref:Cytochrome c oxidase subunit II n=1 Tax=Halovivax asiaticus JCM 14624 TaxID=1227490 RepID=M0BKD8_9EURY|nr:cytochrome c oxidase subunit II [Halovivax asiaticus JCM 14624]
MDIHTYEKAWLGAALVLIVFFIATVTYGTVGAGVEMIDDSGGTVDPNNLADHERFGDPGVEQVGENEYEVNVIASAFFFRPGSDQRGFDPIRVPANSTVTFYVTSSDVIHGFSIPGTNVNTMVIPGEVAELTVEFDEPETYGLLCNEYCGFDHHNMEGTVEVVPEDQYDGGDGQ